MNLVRLTLSCLVLLACSLSFALPGVALAASMVSIASESTNMRDGPGTQFDVLYELARYYPLKVLARQGNWLKVRDFEGDVGWVHSKLTSRRPTFIVKVNQANVRSGPDTNYRVMTRLSYGDVMQTLKSKGRWVKIRLPEFGKTGWVARSLLWGW